MELSELTTDESLTGAPHQIFLPGCFVVLQGISGDGLANTIERTPEYSYYTDDEDEDEDEEDEDEDEDDLDEEESDEHRTHGGDEVPPLEEDHFRPNARLTSSGQVTTTTNTTSASAATSTQPSRGAPAAATTQGTAAPATTATSTATNNNNNNNNPLAAFSGGFLLLSQMTGAAQNPRCSLNNPTLPTSTGAAVAAAAADDTETPPPSQSPPDDSFVVIASEAPNTPTRIRMYAPITTNNSNNQTTTSSAPIHSQMSHNDRRNARRKKRAILQWSQDVWERQRLLRREWKMQQRQHEQQHNYQQRGSTTTTRDTGRSSSTSSTASDEDWWLDSESGHLSITNTLPRLSAQNVVLIEDKIGTLPPGSTVMAKKMYTLDSETLRVIHVDDEQGQERGAVPWPPSIGCIQVLQVELPSASSLSSSSSPPSSPSSSPLLPSSSSSSPVLPTLDSMSSGEESPKQQSKQDSATTPVIGYCIYSVHGYAILVPGIPTLYMDPKTWWWRVTCRVGAFLRQGLELNSDHRCTIPYGSFVQVTRKTVNQQGLSRLRVLAQYEGKQVEGWCSEFLNPLSGQRGHVVQPLPFPVPALYRVTLPEGAVIREQVELSSRQIGQAPFGTILTIVQRQFSEHPQDRCVERLKLAGGRETGWISVRLNQLPPHDKCVVELIGADPRFDPRHPGDFHWQVLEEERIRQLEQEETSTSNNRSSVGPIGNSSGGGPNRDGGDISSVEEGSGSSAEDRRQRAAQRSSKSGFKKSKRQQVETCLICLTEERNATIVHGETGHIACCLVCARILKARGDRCPVCRLEIDSIIQHFWA